MTRTSRHVHACDEPPTLSRFSHLSLCLSACLVSPYLYLLYAAADAGRIWMEAVVYRERDSTQPSILCYKNSDLQESYRSCRGRARLALNLYVSFFYIKTLRQMYSSEDLLVLAWERSHCALSALIWSSLLPCSACAPAACCYLEPSQCTPA